jgi:hypothetical protein
LVSDNSQKISNLRSQISDKKTAVAMSSWDLGGFASRVQFPALPAVVRHGLALPSACFKFQLGYALKLLHQTHIEGEAQNELSFAHGRAKPCLTTGGKADFNELDFEAKPIWNLGSGI